MKKIYYSKSKIIQKIIAGIILVGMCTYALWLAVPGFEIDVLGFYHKLTPFTSVITRLLLLLGLVFFSLIIKSLFDILKSDLLGILITNRDIYYKNVLWKKPVPWDDIANYQIRKKTMGIPFIIFDLKSKNNNTYIKGIFGVSQKPYIGLNDFESSTQEITRELDKYIKRAY